MVKGGFVVGLVRGRQIEARKPGGRRRRRMSPDFIRRNAMR